MNVQLHNTKIYNHDPIIWALKRVSQNITAFEGVCCVVDLMHVFRLKRGPCVMQENSVLSCFSRKFGGTRDTQEQSEIQRKIKAHLIKP